VENVRCTTRLELIFTECTVVYTLVGGFAAVVAIVHATADTEEMTRCTLSSAELGVRSHLDHHVIESPAEILDGSSTSLEPLQIRI
jgi:hypothetical protein